MIITYHGIEFFKVQFGDTIVAFNPVSKDSKFKAAKFGSDIALVSLNNKDMNGADNLSFGERQPFVISGPGEYEIKDIFIKGLKSNSDYGEKGKINTIYSVIMENINMCFLGALADKDLPDATKEALGDIDILFVPIGSDGVLSPAESYKLAVKLEPRIIIPMHYGEVGDKNVLKTFLKEAGEDDVKPIDKLTLKKKDLEGKEAEVMVLNYEA
ncbi:MAG: MBL fold metallo-hydrolase [Candidatus Paceibacterota bacterium]